MRISAGALATFCATEGIEHIHFLKLDVEGHEVAVLRGAQGMLNRGAISMIQFEFGPANIYSRSYFYDFWSLLSDSYDLSESFWKASFRSHTTASTSRCF